MVRLLSILPAITFCFVALGAEGAQVCREDIPATAPDSRFQDNDDGTVTDLATGLIWKQCAAGLSGADCSTGSPSSFTWQLALQHAADNPPWRLPNEHELASLVERRCFDPAINTTYFPSTPSADFWSSSPDSFYLDAWRIDFYSGVLGISLKSSAKPVRLVRDGP